MIVAVLVRIVASLRIYCLESGFENDLPHAFKIFSSAVKIRVAAVDGAATVNEKFVAERMKLRKIPAQLHFRDVLKNKIAKYHVEPMQRTNQEQCLPVVNQINLEVVASIRNIFCRF